MTGVNMWWQLLIGLIRGLALRWLTLIALLWHANRSNLTQVSSREALRLLPDVVRLLRGLAADRSLPRGVRCDWGCCWLTCCCPLT